MPDGVLLVSANIAVDEALEDIAEQLEETAFTRRRVNPPGDPHKNTGRKIPAGLIG